MSFLAAKVGICSEHWDSSVSALPVIHVLYLKEKRAFSEKRLICSGKLVNSKGLKDCVVGCVSQVPLIFGILNCASLHLYFFHVSILVCTHPWSSYFPFSSLNPVLFPGAVSFPSQSFQLPLVPVKLPLRADSCSIKPTALLIFEVVGLVWQRQETVTLL